MLKSKDERKKLEEEVSSVKEFRGILGELDNIFIKKNHDYGNSVHDTYVDFGLVSFVVRIADKYNRLKTLTKKRTQGEVKDESIRDTLIDMANYCILAVKELDAEKGE